METAYSPKEKNLVASANNRTIQRFAPTKLYTRVGDRDRFAAETFFGVAPAAVYSTIFALRGATGGDGLVRFDGVNGISSRRARFFVLNQAHGGRFDRARGSFDRGIVDRGIGSMSSK